MILKAKAFLSKAFLKTSVHTIKIIKKKRLPKWAPARTQTSVPSILCNFVHGHIDDLPMLNCYVLFTLYVTCMIKYSRPSPAFPYCMEATESWAGPGNEAAKCAYVTCHSKRNFSHGNITSLPWTMRLWWDSLINSRRTVI